MQVVGESISHPSKEPPRWQTRRVRRRCWTWPTMTAASLEATSLSARDVMSTHRRPRGGRCAADLVRGQHRRGGGGRRRGRGHSRRARGCCADRRHCANRGRGRRSRRGNCRRDRGRRARGGRSSHLQDLVPRSRADRVKGRASTRRRRARPARRHPTRSARRAGSQGSGRRAPRAYPAPMSEAPTLVRVSPVLLPDPHDRDDQRQPGRCEQRKSWPSLHGARGHGAQSTSRGAPRGTAGIERNKPASAQAVRP